MNEPQHDEGLALGAWNPDVHSALLDLINSHGINSPDYDPERPPLAVFDCDETLICNDIGEALFRFLVTRRHIHADGGFWNLLPDKLGRDAIRAAYNAVAGRADSEVKDTAAYRRYRSGLIGVYEALRGSDMEAAYRFATRALRGLHERTVADLVEECIDYELNRILSQEDIQGGPPFSGLVVPSGVRVYREMYNLLEILEAYGFQSWVVSSSNAYVVRALAKRIGIPAERVLGMELVTQSGIYTDRLVEPVPISEGKLELFLDTVGRSPMLAVGDSMNDFELLENCEGISIAIDHGDEDFVEKAHEMEWLVQTTLTV